MIAEAMAALLGAADPGTAGSATVQDDADRTTHRILDAAVLEAAHVGLNRITVEDVVRRAGVSRMTAYRRYPRRDDLVAAVVLRETRRFLDAVSAGIAAVDDPQDGVVEAFIAAVRFSRGHPMLRRAAVTDSVLPAGDSARLLAMGADFIAARLSGSGGDMQNPAAQRIRWTADVFARLFLTFITCPPVDPDLDDDNALRRFAHEILIPMATSATR